MGKLKTKPKVTKRPPLAERLRESLEDLKAFLQGDTTKATVTVVKLTPAILAIRQLREARLAAKLTQAQVAKKSGLRMETISRLELGKMLNPTIDTLQKYAEAVGCTLTLSVVEKKT